MGDSAPFQCTGSRFHWITKREQKYSTSDIYSQARRKRVGEKPLPTEHFESSGNSELILKCAEISSAQL